MTRTFRASLLVLSNVLVGLESTARAEDPSTTSPEPTETSDDARSVSMETEDEESVAEVLARDARIEATRSRGVRARLAIGQGFHGAGVAIEVCALADCDSARGWVGAATLGLGVGATVGALVSRGDRVRGGTVATYNAAPLLTIGLTAELFVAVNSGRDGIRENGGRSHSASLLAGHLAGYALAFGIDRWLRPTTGEVAAGASSAALGSAVVTLVSIPLADTDRAVRRMMLSYAGVQIGSVFAGGALGRHVRMSPGRALAIDAGAGAGAGVGALAAFLIAGDRLDGTTLRWSLLAGLTAGTATTYVLTRRMPHDRDARPELGVGVSPVPGGAIAQVGGRLR